MPTSMYHLLKTGVTLLWLRLKVRIQHLRLRLKRRSSAPMTLPSNGFQTKIAELQSAGFKVFQAPIGYQRLVDLIEKRVKATFIQDDWSTFKETITRTQQVLGLATIYMGDNLLWIQGPHVDQFHYYKLPPPLWT